MDQEGAQAASISSGPSHRHWWRPAVCQRMGASGWGGGGLTGKMCQARGAETSVILLEGKQKEVVVSMWVGLLQVGSRMPSCTGVLKVHLQLGCGTLPPWATAICAGSAVLIARRNAHVPGSSSRRSSDNVGTDVWWFGVKG